MNIHPLLVHFPIGILGLYAFFEVMRFRFITHQRNYFSLKATLVIIGSIVAYITASTGEMAEDLIGSGKNTVVNATQMPLVETHSMYASITIAVFSVLAVSYLFELLRKRHKLSFLTKIGLLARLSKLIQTLSIPLALGGIVLMTIAGGLGASLVYGPDIDPAVRVIYDTFAPQS